MERLSFSAHRDYLVGMLLSFLDWVTIVSAVIYGNALWFMFLTCLRRLDEVQREKQTPPWGVIFGGLVPASVAVLGLYMVS